MEKDGINQTSKMEEKKTAKFRLGANGKTKGKENKRNGSHEEEEEKKKSKLVEYKRILIFLFLYGKPSSSSSAISLAYSRSCCSRSLRSSADSRSLLYDFGGKRIALTD